MTSFSDIIENNQKTDFYNRQNKTYGYNTLNIINNSSILIHGLHSGYGTEICKHLVLSGVKYIYLYDDRVVNETDMNTGYYYNIINEKYTDALQKNMIDLNTDVSIIPVTTFRCNQDITILIDTSLEIIEEINNYTREINKKLICLFTYGIGGCIFVDAGNNHIIYETSSEVYNDIQIENMNNYGIIYCIDNHGLQNDDNIIFTNLEGTNIKYLQDKEWKITILTKNSLMLNDFEVDNTFTLLNGIIKRIPTQITISHKQFDKNDFINMNINKEKYNDFMPIISILGSLIASETIKLIIHKYLIINQWLIWEDDTVKYINNDILNKLALSNWLIIGAGAIGCEHLKNLSFINIKNITIIDYDTIEKSNLNRQFLFRNSDIGKFKSDIASNAITKIKSDIHIQSLTCKLDKDTCIDFTKFTGILGAVDNNAARLFIDSIAVKFSIPFFDCGTEGLKGSTQPIIPYITEKWSDSSDIETPSIPVCTIKSFPYNANHLIHWALDTFSIFSNNDYKEYNTLLKCKHYALDLFETLFIKNIHTLLEEHPVDQLIDNKLFWSGGKICPNIIIFDKDNYNHNTFIELTSKIINNNAVLFDKDNNEHILWLTCASNIRASNYNLPNITFDIAKSIAGHIIPAVSTTTSMISGLTVLELLKYIININSYKSSFVNLSIPIIINSEPLKPKTINGLDNIWQSYIYNNNTTLLEFKNYYENLFKLDINIILFDTVPIYINELEESNLQLMISDLLLGKLQIDVNIYSDSSYELPNITIKLN